MLSICQVLVPNYLLRIRNSIQCVGRSGGNDYRMMRSSNDRQCKVLPFLSWFFLHCFTEIVYAAIKTDEFAELVNAIEFFAKLIKKANNLR